MKKIGSILLSVLMLAAFVSCDDTSTEMDKHYNGTFDIKYGLGKVLEYDPVNVNGIDVCQYFDFFETLRFTLHVTDGKITSLSYTNADIPFSPFDFDAPSGDVDCYLDTNVLPNALKLTSTGQAIAYFRNGEFYIPFQLDCKELSYEYRFKEITE